MAAMNKDNNSLERLKGLLKTLFQFDATELDFGIYRIMNYKRKEIKAFIEKDLIKGVEKEFERYKTQSGKELLEKLQERKKEIEKLGKDLGEKIFKNGEIEEKFKEKPFATEYLELKKQLEEIEVAESAKTQVFNDLYNFFSRYYEDGDFISQRRYSSKNEKYAIPYSGEEVKLYWANFDQYYVKTGEIFKDYEFNLKGWSITFRTIFAEVESGNIKGERRYFILGEDEPVKVDKERKSCLIQFEYRPLTEKVSQQYRVKTKAGEEKKTGIQQDEINAILKDKILQKIKEVELQAVLTEEQDEKTILEKHLYKYTRKITSDFFIHKNLKGFLERELDYFIKTEVVDLNNLEPRHITRAKVVEGIGKRIIEFLSQIEEFQKMLWEKKKFVLKTDYVITIDRVPKEFHKEILKNKEQLKEWAELGFGKIDKGNTLIGKKLPVDTQHFGDDFKERLLEKLSEQGNLDDLMDGILIKSENWQAINLLLQKYCGEVKCIYIDPPYNTGSDEFIYKDKYQHSCWLSMVTDRLELSREMLSPSGTIGISIDNNEIEHLLKLMDLLFENRRAIVTVKRGSVTGPKVINPGVVNVAEFLVIYSKEGANWKPNRVYKVRERDRRYSKFIINREQDPSKWVFLPLLQAFGEFKGIRKLSLRKALGDDYEKELSQFILAHANAVARTAALDADKISKEAIELKQRSLRSPNTIYHFKREEHEDWYIMGGERILFYSDRLVRVGSELVQGELLTDIWDDTLPNDLHNEGGVTLKKGKKPEKLVGRFLELATESGDLVLDFFTGSGTACAAAQKLGRKWIGVDMADFFDSLLLRRLKNTLFGEKSGISSTNNWKGGGFFAYQQLEAYDDTLHNIEFPEAEKGQKTLEIFGKGDGGNEYLMKYFLQYENEGSPSLLNLKQFENPFEYKLKIISNSKGEGVANVDLVETFNYLIGLRLNRYKFPQENGRRYVIVFGERGNRKVAVVWRSTKDINLEKDKEVIDKAIGDFEPDEVFINGDAFYPKGYKVIETEFKALMGV